MLARSIYLVCIKCLLFLPVVTLSALISNVMICPVIIMVFFGVTWNTVFVLGSIVWLYPLIPIGRMLLRLFPVHLGHKNTHLKYENSIVFIFWCISTFAFYAVLMLAYHHAFFGSKSKLQESLNEGLYFFVCFIVGVIVVASFVYILEIRKRSIRHIDGCCLFLRRFGGAGEFAFLPILKKSLPKDVRLCMLIEEGAIIKAWDFLTIGFTPFISYRIFFVNYFQGADSDWIENAKTLLEKSDCVVMDLSDLSTSIHKELELIVSVEAESKMIWLTTKSTISCRESLGTYEVSPAIGRILSSSLSTRKKSYFRMYLVFHLFFISLVILESLLEWILKIEVNDGYFRLFSVLISAWLSFLIFGRESITGFWNDRLQKRLTDEIRRIMTNPTDRRFDNLNS